MLLLLTALVATVFAMGDTIVDDDNEDVSPAPSIYTFK